MANIPWGARFGKSVLKDHVVTVDGQYESRTGSCSFCQDQLFRIGEDLFFLAHRRKARKSTIHCMTTQQTL
jgi:hypothetical protein